VCCHYGVFKVHAGRLTCPTEKHRARGHGLSKLNSVRTATSRSTLFLGEFSHRTTISRDRHRRAERLPE
jgi:hypothetical protein